MDFVKPLLAHLPKRIRLIIRADSGYFVGALLDLLDTGSHGYLIEVKLKNPIPWLAKQHWTAITGQPGWRQCRFAHRGGDWSATRTLAAVHRTLPKTDSRQLDLLDTTEYDYFCYATTESLTPWQACLKNTVSGRPAKPADRGSRRANGLGASANRQLFGERRVIPLRGTGLQYFALDDLAERQCHASATGTIRTYLVRVAGKLLAPATGN